MRLTDMASPCSALNRQLPQVSLGRRSAPACPATAGAPSTTAGTENRNDVTTNSLPFGALERIITNLTDSQTTLSQTVYSNYFNYFDLRSEDCEHTWDRTTAPKRPAPPQRLKRDRFSPDGALIKLQWTQLSAPCRGVT